MTRKIIDFAAIVSLLALLATSAHAQQTVNGQPVVPASQITGTLPIANGGTGATTAPAALTALGAGLPSWRIYLSGSQSFTTGGSAKVIQFNAVTSDAASVCNTTSTYICTPNKAGWYRIRCRAEIGATTGGATGTEIGWLQITLNGSTLQSISRFPAQAGSLSSPLIGLEVTDDVQLNGSTDTVGCSAFSDATGPSIVGLTAYTSMTGDFLHP